MSQILLIKKKTMHQLSHFSSHFTDNFSNIADLMLPIGTFAETSGTFINCEGSWQSFNSVSSPVHEARPGWKVLTVIGDLLKLDGFEFESSLDVLSELREKLGKTETSNNPEKYKNQSNGNKKASVERVPMYQMDAILRHSPPLQLTPEAQRDSKALNISSLMPAFVFEQWNLIPGYIQDLLIITVPNSVYSICVILAVAFTTYFERKSLVTCKAGLDQISGSRRGLVGQLCGCDQTPNQRGCRSI